MADLKLCPFCGGTATLRTTGGWSGIGCSTAKCPALLLALVFRTPEEARAVWNRRATVGIAIPDAPSGRVVWALDEEQRLYEALAKGIELVGRIGFDAITTIVIGLAVLLVETRVLKDGWQPPADGVKEDGNG